MLTQPQIPAALGSSQWSADAATAAGGDPKLWDASN